ncbi:MSMEG_4193 family putative phosphomutase [Luteococcus sp. OSA5]|uniref:MSMEG_4193 family putative phosphomutase n=1 Tax=Luteococcus sp. OSA5 TaxID=3401630 RepID=UPI003B4324BF
MSILLLARHGRSTSNTAGTLAGRSAGVLLDERGRSQAMALGERLRGLALDLVVHSPMDRCVETMQLALDSAGLQVEVCEDGRFTECDYGQWSGRSLAELGDEALWREVQQHPSRVTFPGGESMQEMADRMVDGVAEVNRRLHEAHPDAEPVWLLVSHGDPIKAVLSHCLGQPLDEFQRIIVDPASLSVVRLPSPADTDGKPAVVAMNTTSGLVSRMVPGRAAPGPQLGGGLGSQQD